MAGGASTSHACLPLLQPPAHRRTASLQGHPQRLPRLLHRRDARVSRRHSQEGLCKRKHPPLSPPLRGCYLDSVERVRSGQPQSTSRDGVKRRALSTYGCHTKLSTQHKRHAKRRRDSTTGRRAWWGRAHCQEKRLGRPRPVRCGSLSEPLVAPPPPPLPPPPPSPSSPHPGDVRRWPSTAQGKHHREPARGTG
jgi:hypothetical protein